MSKNKKNISRSKFSIETLRSKLFKGRVRKILSISFVIILALMVLGFVLDHFVFQPVKNPEYGVSFSKKRAVELELNWQDNFTALLDDLKIRNFRLMSYWDEHEPFRGKLNFQVLDWQMDEAAKRGAKVTLATGLRQPRWPECHQPEWAKNLGGNEWKQALYAYMEIVTKRYKDHPALQSWQLENEAVNGWFGICDKADHARINEEFALLRKWDPKTPIWMSLSDQHGLPLFVPKPDAWGFSVYKIVYNTHFIPFYLNYPTPTWYHRLRATILKVIYKNDLFVHELQMEPWGPYDTKFMDIKEQDKSMSTKLIPTLFDFGRRIGFKRMDLWGSEWWYWRKVYFKDNSVWETVRTELNKK